MKKLTLALALSTTLAACSGVTYPEPGWVNLEKNDIIDGVSISSVSTTKYWDRFVSVVQRNGNLFVFFQTGNLASNNRYRNTHNVHFLLDGVVIKEVMKSTRQGKQLYFEGEKAKEWITRLNKGNELFMRVITSYKSDEAVFDISGQTRFQ